MLKKKVLRFSPQKNYPLYHIVNCTDSTVRQLTISSTRARLKPTITWEIKRKSFLASDLDTKISSLLFKTKTCFEKIDLFLG